VLLLLLLLLAQVYLHEIASKRHKGFTGSIGFASAISGCMLGVLAVLVLEVALSPAQMLQFGWRLPFLASVVSASAALGLRLHMPEPTEFLQVRVWVGGLGCFIQGTGGGLNGAAHMVGAGTAWGGQGVTKGRRNTMQSLCQHAGSVAPQPLSTRQS
jgi:hypothetical protein